MKSTLKFAALLVIFSFIQPSSFAQTTSQDTTAKTQTPASEAKEYSENVYASHTLLTPTGFGLKKGTGYYKNTMMMLNEVQYGFTDHFSIGVGGAISSIVPAYITSKVTFDVIENFHIGTGVLLTSVYNYRYDGKPKKSLGGLVYSVGTIGNRDNNLTIGAGLGFSNGKFSENKVILVSGQARVSERLSLITENNFADGTTILSGGCRYMAKNFALNFGLLYLPNETPKGGYFENLPPLPYFGVTLPFGK